MSITLRSPWDKVSTYSVTRVPFQFYLHACYLQGFCGRGGSWHSHLKTMDFIKLDLGLGPPPGPGSGSKTGLSSKQIANPVAQRAHSPLEGAIPTGSPWSIDEPIPTRDAEAADEDLYRGLSAELQTSEADPKPENQQRGCFCRHCGRWFEVWYRLGQHLRHTLECREAVKLLKGGDTGGKKREKGGLGTQETPRLADGFESRLADGIESGYFNKTVVGMGSVCADLDGGPDGEALSEEGGDDASGKESGGQFNQDISIGFFSGAGRMGERDGGGPERADVGGVKESVSEHGRKRPLKPAAGKTVCGASTKAGAKCMRTPLNGGKFCKRHERAEKEQKGEQVSGRVMG
jgi:hypothetical protein